MQKLKGGRVESILLGESNFDIGTTSKNSKLEEIVSLYSIMACSPTSMNIYA